MKIFSSYKKFAGIGLIILGILFCAYKVFPWGSFYGLDGIKEAATHQSILQEAYNLLSNDPGMRRFNGRITFPEGQQVSIENIMAYAGVYGNPLTLSAYGPGPDADGATPYSFHWYNPMTGQGKAPQAVYTHYLAFVNAAWGAANLDEHALRGIAWSAHFIADMFVPYHVVGLSLQEAIARINARNFYLNEKEAGPLYLYSPVPPVQEENGIFKFPQEVISRWWRKGWGVNNEHSAAFQVFWGHRMKAGKNDAKNPIDWFDPWYWNGLISRSLLSSHASYEARAHALWRSTGFQRNFETDHYYDPLWRNAPVDYSLQTEPWETQAFQVQEYTQKIAARTRQNIEAIWRVPTLGIQGAVQAVYTLWRSAFSALETNVRIQPDPERSDAYYITAQISNAAYEPCQNVQATLTIQKGSEIVLQNSQMLSAALDFRKPQTVSWHIQMKPDLNIPYIFTSEAVGVFNRTPDLQYAQDVMFYRPEKREDVVEDWEETETLNYEGVDFREGRRAFSDVVAGFQAGDGSKEKYTNPNNALGPPKTENGFTALGHNGVLIVAFSKVMLVDGNGPDLYVFEIGPMIEPFRVEISADGRSWIDLGVVRGQPSMLDIAGKGAPGQGYRYVRITDAGSRMSGSPYAGADIDAVGAINAVRR
jgi:hypothetical protein